jgi:hypothetical protein
MLKPLSPSLTRKSLGCGPRPWMVAALAAAGVTLAAAAAQARTLRVPRDYPTIQGAVDAAAAGDDIEVGKGRHCGATITKPVTLTSAKEHRATIVGCPGGPFLIGALRVGFLLPGAPGNGPAGGTKIRGFAFDGKGVSGGNLAPLAFGVFARFTDHVTVKDNRFVGTVQAITNTAGDNWAIADNEIDDLTLFDCAAGGLCGGGVGIAVQVASAAIGAPGGAANPANRPEATAVVDNAIQGRAPAGFDVFNMVGILVFAADGTAVVDNDTEIRPGVDGAEPLGVGVLVTNRCCGDPTELVPGARYASVIKHDDCSQFGVVVEGVGGANTQGLVLFRNEGRALVEGAPALRADAARLALVPAAATLGAQRTRFE